MRGERVEDDGRSGRQKDSIAEENIKVVHTLVMCDKRRELQSIASKVGISFGAVQSILTDIFGMSKVSARRVPWLLTNDQKRSLLNISRYLLSRYEDDPGDFFRASCNPRWHGFTILTKVKNGYYWLLSVHKTEIWSSWYTVWKQRRRYGGNTRVLVGQRKCLLFLV